MIKPIMAALAFGVAAGYFNNNWGNAFAGSFVSDHLFNASLMLLLFVMGLIFGIDKEATARLRMKGARVLVIPFAIALGSILGGLVAGLILRIDPIASMAVCAGYGWYTLAGPLIAQVFGTTWGALGLAVNFMRELFTIATVSLAVKVDKYAPVALGGATAMDTTLPVIVRYCGNDMLITAFSSGFILTATAPITIAAIASLK
jgi:uncharacterized membrane protein YbjE (DUF340 family)